MDAPLKLGRLDMVPFSKICSRFMIYDDPVGDETNPPGLYLHLTTDMIAPVRKRGLLRLAPLHEGREIPYTYNATPSKLTIETEYGNIDFAIDEPPILRVRAGGVGLRAFSAMGRMEIPVEMNDGTFELSYSSAIGNILFVPIAGSMTFNSGWRLKEWRADDVTVELTPDENGMLELAIHEFNHAGAAQENYRPFDLCLDDSEREFNTWLKKYGTPPEELRDLARLAAYITWICVQQPRINGIPSVLGGNAMYDRRWGLEVMNIFEQTVNALAFRDETARREIAESVLRLKAPDGMLPVWANDKDRQYGCAAPPAIALALDAAEDDTLASIIGWWLSWRDSDYDGIPEYAYSREPGFEAGLRITGGRAVESPDLTAYLILLAELLGKSRRADAPKWIEVADGLKHKLFSALWDSDRFVARKSVTHEITESGNFIRYIPIILGKSLPDEIAKKLGDDIGQDKPWVRARDIPLGAMLISGLRATGREDIAREICAWLTDAVREHGFLNNEGDGMYSSWCASAFLYAITI